MKKIIYSVLALAIVATGPAHAINAKYRAQLEHSGCTQESINYGCDIHKTKIQNEKLSRLPKTKAGEEQRAWMEENALGANINELADTLLAKGWKPYQGEWLKGDKHLQLTVANEKVVAVNLY